MKIFSPLLYASAIYWILSGSASAQSFVNWVGGTSNWNAGSSWFNEALAQTGSLPSADFDEIARIDNGGIVSVTTPLANGVDQGFTTNPAEVRLATVAGTGELVIAAGGSLRVQDTSLTNGSISVGGGLGGATLRVLPGGSLTVDGAIASGTSTANLIQFGAATGAGTAAVSTGSASFGGTTITHRNASVSATGSLGLQGSSVYRPVFSAGLTSTLQAAGSVSLGGVLRPDFGGVAPAVGTSWQLFEGAAVSGSFSSIDSSLAGALGAGQAFAVNTINVAGNRKSVQLGLRQLAFINVNRDTGVVTLTNPGGTAVSMDGYTISSAHGGLNGATWNSLTDQGALGGSWRESPTSSTRLSELKRTGVGSLAAGQSISLGPIFSPNPVTLGAPTEDLGFQFTSPNGQLDGVVTYSGTKVNNLLLQIDPSNGNARLRNTSNFTFAIDGYTIASASGSITPGGWTSLDDQNAAGGDWRESPVLASRLSELKRAGGATLAPGASFNLGAIFNPALSKDLTLNFVKFGESDPTVGAVVYAAFSASVPGDFNSDGVVNGADLTRWRSSFGTNANADADGDSDSDGADFLTWQRNLGSSGTPAFGAAAAVPEPSALLIASIFSGVVGFSRTRCSRRTHEE
jgi:hypothetical protein